MTKKIVPIRKPSTPPPDDWDIREAIEILTGEVQALHRYVQKLVGLLQNGGD